MAEPEWVSGDDIARGVVTECWDCGAIAVRHDECEECGARNEDYNPFDYNPFDYYRG